MPTPNFVTCTGLPPSAFAIQISAPPERVESNTIFRASGEYCAIMSLPAEEMTLTILPGRFPGWISSMLHVLT